MKLGILGGTFDPIHYGHLAAARAGQLVLGLDRVLLIPSHFPPHRGRAPVASGFHRFAMVALAVDGEATFEASDLELTRPGLSFSIDTISALHGQGWQPVQLFFITGVDAFADVRTWKGFPELLNGCHFVVVTRPGHREDLLKTRLPDLAPRFLDAAEATRHVDLLSGPDTRVILIEAPTDDVSSTDVRQRIASHQDVRGLVPDTVERYIRKHHLYHPHPEQASALHG